MSNTGKERGSVGNTGIGTVLVRSIGVGTGPVINTRKETVMLAKLLRIIIIMIIMRGLLNRNIARSLCKKGY